MRPHLVLLAVAAMLSLGAFVVGQERKRETDHLLTEDRLAHGLRADEVDARGCPKIVAVFFGNQDPSKAMEKLLLEPDLARKEMRALANGLNLKARKQEKGVQPNGRIALLWQVKGDELRRSTADKDNAFDLETDRLVASVAVLDAKAVRSGKWVEREEVRFPKPPAKWNEKTHRVTRFSVQAPAVGLSLSSMRPPSDGAFTAEDESWAATRTTIEDRIADWMHKTNAKKQYVNEADRVVTLVIYQYARAEDRAPSGYRLLAISGTGNLDAQFDGFLSKSNAPVSAAVRREFNDNVPKR